MYMLTLANEAIQFQDTDDSVELYFLQLVKDSFWRLRTFSSQGSSVPGFSEGISTSSVLL